MIERHDLHLDPRSHPWRVNLDNQQWRFTTKTDAKVLLDVCDKAGGVITYDPYDRPLGIDDLTQDMIQNECWWWCRRHEQAHRNGVRCELDEDGPYPYHTGCIDIGPFMTRLEAERLEGDGWSPEPVPLGMKVEQPTFPTLGPRPS